VIRPNFLREDTAMKMPLTVFAMVLMITLPTIESVQAAEGSNWKIGRVYNRFVCNACHRQDNDRIVSPYERNKADWQAYFDADKHDATGKSNPSALHYTSVAYRQSVKDKNKAAAKFIKMSDQQMAAHVIAFYIRGAKDSDTPARCQ
jgi:hypothetical protein